MLADEVDGTIVIGVDVAESLTGAEKPAVPEDFGNIAEYAPVTIIAGPIATNKSCIVDGKNLPPNNPSSIAAAPPPTPTNTEGFFQSNVAVVGVDLSTYSLKIKGIAAPAALPAIYIPFFMIKNE